MILLAAHAHAVQYYVRTDGNDSNAGTANTSGGAWLTIQKAANTMIAGDTVTIAAGAYPENVVSGADGTNGNPITFTASGAVYVYGWRLNHAYQIVQGITVRHNASANADGAVEFDNNGDNCIVEDCTIGPGMWIKRTDWVFSDSNPDTLSTATGGLIAAGFRSGISVRIQDTESTTDINAGNVGTFLVASVTDTTITFDNAVLIVAESAKKAYVHGSLNAVVFNTGTSNSIFRDSTLEDTASRWCLGSGTDNTMEGCTLINSDGFDGILYSGTRFTVRRNLIKDCLTVQYWSPSPDMLSVMTPGTVDNILIEENMVIDCIGALGFDHGVMNPGPITFRKNVFSNVGHGYLVWTNNMTFDRNTFYRVAQAGTIVAQSQNHPLTWNNGTYDPTAATVTSNLLISCGNGLGPTVGWYSTSAEPGLVLTANYNYVAGPAPSYATKTGFSETNGINGGNPLFVNAADPIGPDGIAFTADDGLRLAAGSPAIGVGPAGADLGAYDYSASPPPVESGTINATTTTAGTVTVQ